MNKDIIIILRYIMIKIYFIYKIDINQKNLKLNNEWLNENSFIY